jgi:hypothetical protein
VRHLLCLIGWSSTLSSDKASCLGINVSNAGSSFHSYFVLNPDILDTNYFGNDQNLSMFGWPDGEKIPALNTPRLFNRAGNPINHVHLYSRPSFNLDDKYYAEQSPLYITSLYASKV